MQFGYLDTMRGHELHVQFITGYHNVVSLDTSITFLGTLEGIECPVCAIVFQNSNVDLLFIFSFLRDSHLFSLS